MSLYDAIPAEMQDFRYSSCLKKKYHLTEEDAKQSLRRIKDRGEMKPLHVYFCSFCHHWHVGGCEPEEAEDHIRTYEGQPYTINSTQKSPEDAARYKRYMQRKGYSVIIRKKQNKSKIRRIYQIWVHKEES